MRLTIRTGSSTFHILPLFTTAKPLRTIALSGANPQTKDKRTRAGRVDAIQTAFRRAGLDQASGALLAGLVGRGILESRTPRMHEAEGARLGLRYRYRLIDFDQLRLDDDALDEVIGFAAEIGFAGLNVTHPFKESVLASLGTIAPTAAAIGAVNTVVLLDGKRVGHNTDCWGFAESFRRGMSGVSLDHVVLIGAGGAGMAVAQALLELGVRQLSIHDLIPAKAAALAARFAGAGDRVAAIDDVAWAVRVASGIVNASPAGMAKYPGSPVPAALLHPGVWIADIVYFPRETVLLQAARAAGCRTLSGTGMAVFQALRAFELITGKTPDADHMARHFSAG